MSNLHGLLNREANSPKCRSKCCSKDRIVPRSRHRIVAAVAALDNTVAVLDNLDNTVAALGSIDYRPLAVG